MLFVHFPPPMHESGILFGSHEPDFITWKPVSYLAVGISSFGRILMVSYVWQNNIRLFTFVNVQVGQQVRNFVKFVNPAEPLEKDGTNVNPHTSVLLKNIKPHKISKCGFPLRVCRALFNLHKLSLIAANIIGKIGRIEYN